MSYLRYDEDSSTDDGKATQDRSNDDGSQVAFDLTGISVIWKSKERSERTGLVDSSELSSSTAPASLLVGVGVVAEGEEVE